MSRLASSTSLATPLAIRRTASQACKYTARTVIHAFGTLALIVHTDPLSVYDTNPVQDVGDWHPRADRHHPELCCSEPHENELGMQPGILGSDMWISDSFTVAFYHHPITNVLLK